MYDSGVAFPDTQQGSQPSPDYPPIHRIIAEARGTQVSLNAQMSEDRLRAAFERGSAALTAFAMKDKLVGRPAELTGDGLRDPLSELDNNGGIRLSSRSAKTYDNGIRFTPAREGTFEGFYYKIQNRLGEKSLGIFVAQISMGMIRRADGLYVPLAYCPVDTAILEFTDDKIEMEKTRLRNIIYGDESVGESTLQQIDKTHSLVRDQSPEWMFEPKNLQKLAGMTNQLASEADFRGNHSVSAATLDLLSLELGLPRPVTVESVFHQYRQNGQTSPPHAGETRFSHIQPRLVINPGSLTGRPEVCFSTTYNDSATDPSEDRVVHIPLRSISRVTSES